MKKSTREYLEISGEEIVGTKTYLVSILAEYFGSVLPNSPKLKQWYRKKDVESARRQLMEKIVLWAVSSQKPSDTLTFWQTLTHDQLVKAVEYCRLFQGDLELLEYFEDKFHNLLLPKNINITFTLASI
jgi:hypothetical protein